jgi:AcrR family transcriptional regulator
MNMATINGDNGVDSAALVEGDATGEPRKRRKEARPGELMTAALSLFAERGFSATRMDDVAARAGVTKGTLYLYFTSKEALLEAVVRESIVPVIGDAAQMLAQHQGSSAELLALLLKSWWQRVGATPAGAVPKLIIAEAQNFPELTQFYFEHVIERGSDLIKQVLRRGVASGEFRALNVDVVYHTVMSPVIMLMIWSHSFAPCCGDALDPDVYLNATIDLLLRGIVSTSPVSGDS